MPLLKHGPQKQAGSQGACKLQLRGAARRVSGERVVCNSGAWQSWASNHAGAFVMGWRQSKTFRPPSTHVKSPRLPGMRQPELCPAQVGREGPCQETGHLLMEGRRQVPPLAGVAGGELGLGPAQRSPGQRHCLRLTGVKTQGQKFGLLSQLGAGSLSDPGTVCWTWAIK